MNKRTLNKFDKNYFFAMDSQEIEAICQCVSKEVLDFFMGVTGALVLAGEGEYIEIWLTDSNRPYLFETVYYQAV